MKRILFIAVLVLGLLSCQKEELPTVEHCNKGIITELGVYRDTETISGDRYEYYVWIIDECTGDLVRCEVNKSWFDQLNRGDYFEYPFN